MPPPSGVTSDAVLVGGRAGGSPGHEVSCAICSGFERASETIWLGKLQTPRRRTWILPATHVMTHGSAFEGSPR